MKMKKKKWNFFDCFFYYWLWRKKNGDLQLKELRSLKKNDEMIEFGEKVFGILVRKCCSLSPIVHASSRSHKRTFSSKLFFCLSEMKFYLG